MYQVTDISDDKKEPLVIKIQKCTQTFYEEINALIDTQVTSEKKKVDVIQFGKTSQVVAFGQFIMVDCAEADCAKSNELKLSESNSRQMAFMVMRRHGIDLQ